MKSNTNQRGFAFGDFDLFGAETAGIANDYDKCEGCGHVFPAIALWENLCGECQLRGLESGELVYAVTFTPTED